MKQLIERWESIDGKYWAELYKVDEGYIYSFPRGGGYLGTSREQFDKKLCSGYFIWDKSQTIMKCTYKVIDIGFTQAELCLLKQCLNKEWHNFNKSYRKYNCEHDRLVMCKLDSILGKLPRDYYGQ